MERTAVAVAMSHSKHTQELYYSLKKGKKDPVEGYRVMEGIRTAEREGRELGMPWGELWLWGLSGRRGQGIFYSFIYSHCCLHSCCNATNWKVAVEVKEILGFNFFSSLVEKVKSHISQE